MFVEELMKTTNLLMYGYWVVQALIKYVFI